MKKTQQFLQKRKRPPIRPLRYLPRQLLMRLHKPHRSEHLPAPTIFLLRAQVDDLLEPFDGVLGAERGCGEGEVVFDVEAGGSVEDGVVDVFGVVVGRSFCGPVYILVDFWEESNTDTRCATKCGVSIQHALKKASLTSTLSPCQLDIRKESKQHITEVKENGDYEHGGLFYSISL